MSQPYGMIEARCWNEISERTGKSMWYWTVLMIEKNSQGERIGRSQYSGSSRCFATALGDLMDQINSVR